MNDQPKLTTKQAIVVQAAFGCFSAYGFSRTTMADIAKAAQMSRPALYLLFENKRDIARALVIQMKQTSLQTANTAFASKAPFADQLRAAIHARTTAFFESVEGSAHGQELFDTGLELASDILLASENEFEKILQKALRRAAKSGEVQLPAKVSIPRIAETIVRGTHGQKTGAASAKVLRKRINDFLDLILAGIQR